MLYDYHNIICVMLVCLYFLLSLLAWRERNLRFQLRKGVGVTFMVLYLAAVGVANSYCYIKGGRWWLYYALTSVALNDSCAYFAGRLFGKHHLIGLSPNKTIEGFVGGTIGNTILAYIGAVHFLKGDFWQCPPGHINYSLFEDWKCD